MLPLQVADTVRRSLGGTTLDVVLATLAGAVGRYLSLHYVNPATLDLRVSLPVALEAAGGGPSVPNVDTDTVDRDRATEAASAKEQKARALREDLAGDGGLADDGAPTALDQCPRVGALLHVLPVDEALDRTRALGEVRAAELGAVGGHVDADRVTGREDQAQDEAPAGRLPDDSQQQVGPTAGGANSRWGNRGSPP